MKIILDLSDTIFHRLRAVAERRSTTPEALAAAYVEDWLSIDYPDMLGRTSRRSLYRDGPIAFDAVAAEAAARVEQDVSEIEKRRAGNDSN